ncbi:MAG: hypothetical protein ACD_50C00014G0003 [uncultured bacterium]|uniref:PIN domain-containing protein n=1 Tax=Candidatus Daviesbacteria bacterium RIFCSPHIGHO2_12_FULL_43_11 TaxID=1797780 RepID=A0A1F5K3T4_9BACT|nr:MAG: hypothetical protein ACD_50C00014G0003 [uncultured bacterium]OGE35418.1 MAG: hypothetical protein A3E45_00100 [Candidatus Daviesbacteria bacterium RIFCSPHIGHO2_12_FULL_43_11]OGH45161.1 MAG: hypothetical protein A3H82_00755 [Candidatus Levybacteria bacterium RIFCSPLOWO2_02_FULL_39_26]
MNNPVIADSSALVSLIFPTDSNNKKALTITKILSKTSRPLIIPGDIFTETINLIGKKIDHKIACITGDKFLKDKRFIIIDTTEEIRLSAFTKFKIQSKSVSFTDCVVMALADHFDTKDIFGFDEIFKKNGYVRLGIDKK